MTLHTGLAQGRWRTFTLVEQMANIGSEIGRALSSRKQGNEERCRNALERGLELFDLTILDPRWSSRLKEILRAREIVCDYFIGDNVYHSTPEFMERYFLSFAAAARSRR